MGLEEYKLTENFVENKFELITKLFDKIILDLKYVKKYHDIEKPTDIFDRKSRDNYNFLITNRTEKLHNIIDIIDMLKKSLDMETETLKSSSEYLYGLYEYQLLNIYKLTIDLNIDIINSLINVFTELREGWKDSVELEKNK